MFTDSKELIEFRKELNVHHFQPGITGLAQVQGIDMSDPLLLAKTEHKMIKEFNLINYFWFIFKTLIGNGLRIELRKEFKRNVNN